MRCGNVEPLVERYVDGDLDAATAQGVEKHVRTCGRCTARVAAARKLLAAFEAEPAVTAPAGFTAAVMDAVYREALAPRTADSAEEARFFAPQAGTPRPLPLLRMYRRLGMSLVLTAAVLTASLFVPRAAYSTFLTERGMGAGFAEGSAAIAQGTLEKAGRSIQGLMGGKDSGGGITR